MTAQMPITGVAGRGSTLQGYVRRTLGAVMTLAYVIVGVMLVGGLALAGAMIAGIYYGVSGSRPELLEKDRERR
jgi:hypothetical protein